MANARKIAASALLEVEKSGAYSNITLNKMLSGAEITKEDRALATAIFYGVLDRKITIDYVLSKFLTKPIKKLPPYTACVLRSALYQIMYMERIPHSAAVNEAVKLIKASKERFSQGLVNAVLRNALRTEVKLPDGKTNEELSIKYSCPLYIIESFIKDYGADCAVGILEQTLLAPPVILQVNTLKTDAEALKKALEAEGTSAEITEYGKCVSVTDGIDVKNSISYKKGLFYIQDLASRRSIEALGLKENERILDLCAAPGGKSFTACNIMKNKGEILAFDLYEKRTELISKTAGRLGFDSVKAKVGDAAVFNEDLGSFDAVICDVPCSGLGVLRRKPEIKYKPCGEFDSLPSIQQKILENAFRYVKTGGRILYSTCTLRKAENEKVTNALLDKFANTELKYQHTYFPQTDGTDGFYCAVIEKKGD